jgi:hypothetical protein
VAPLLVATKSPPPPGVFQGTVLNFAKFHVTSPGLGAKPWPVPPKPGPGNPVVPLVPPAQFVVTSKRPIVLAWAPDPATADAIITLTGPTSNAGTIDLSTADGQYGGLVTVGGVTGYSVWGLLGTVTTTTPPGDNGKNAILRYYVLATATNGNQSLIALGEINPTFSGSANPDLVTFSGNTASLAFTLPGAAGRDLTNLTSLQLLSVPALPLVTNAQPSTSVMLAGNVSFPGAYTFQGSDAQNVPAITETVSGDTYTGPPLFTLIDPSDPNILNQYVVTAGTDGYEVLFSLAELDPAFGASTAINQVDLVPYADTAGTLPIPNGFARIITPADTPFAHGRWVSNLDLIAVDAVPEPASAALLMSGLIGMGIGVRWRLRRSPN